MDRMLNHKDTDFTFAPGWILSFDKGRFGAEWKQESILTWSSHLILFLRDGLLTRGQWILCVNVFLSREKVYSFIYILKRIQDPKRLKIMTPEKMYVFMWHCMSQLLFLVLENLLPF